MVITLQSSDSFQDCNDGNITFGIPHECVAADVSPKSSKLSVKLYQLTGDRIRVFQSVVLVASGLMSLASPLYMISGLAFGQSLQLIAEMNCVPSGIRIASRSSRWIVRPFELRNTKSTDALTPVTHVYIHAGGIIGTMFFQFLIAEVLRHSQSLKSQEAYAMTYFPHVSLIVTYALTPGLVSSAARVISDDTTSNTTVIGTAIVCFLIELVAVVVIAYGTFLTDPVYEVRPQPHGLLFVTGHWKEGPLRQRWLCLLTECGEGRKKAYPALLLVYLVAVSVGTGFHVTTEEKCGNQFGGLFAVQAVFCVSFLSIQPMRSLWLRGFSIGVVLTQICFVCVAWFRITNVRKDYTIGRDGLNGLIGLCSLVSILFVVSTFVVALQEWTGLDCCPDDGAELSDDEEEREENEDDDEVTVLVPPSSGVEGGKSVELYQQPKPGVTWDDLQQPLVEKGGRSNSGMFRSEESVSYSFSRPDYSSL
eukprot:PhF_6_TR36485/c0_g1_i1/m.53603